MHIWGAICWRSSTWEKTKFYCNHSRYVREGVWSFYGRFPSVSRPCLSSPIGSYFVQRWCVLSHHSLWPRCGCFGKLCVRVTTTNPIHIQPIPRRVSQKHNQKHPRHTLSLGLYLDFSVPTFVPSHFARCHLCIHFIHLVIVDITKWNLWPVDTQNAESNITICC